MSSVDITAATIEFRCPIHDCALESTSDYTPGRHLWEMVGRGLELGVEFDLPAALMCKPGWYDAQEADLGDHETEPCRASWVVTASGVELPEAAAWTDDNIAEAVEALTPVDPDSLSSDQTDLLVVLDAFGPIGDGDGVLHARIISGARRIAARNRLATLNLITVTPSQYGLTLDITADGRAVAAKLTDHE